MAEIIEAILLFLQTELFAVAGISITGLYAVIAGAAVILIIVIICICAGAKKRRQKISAKDQETTDFQLTKEENVTSTKNEENQTETEETAAASTVAETATETVEIKADAQAEKSNENGQTDTAAKPDTENPIESDIPAAVEVETDTQVSTETKTETDTQVSTETKTETVKTDAKKSSVPKKPKFVPVEKTGSPSKPVAPKTSDKSTSASKAVAKSSARFAQTGTFEFSKHNDKIYFYLYANNGQMLFESRPYSSLTTAKNAVFTFIKNVAENDLIVEGDKNDNFHWTLTKGSMVIDGISYDSKASAEANAQSVKNFSATAIIGEKLVD